MFRDGSTTTGHSLGWRTMPETLRYSVVASTQTLWLALRASGIGLGWLSILDPERLAAALDLPTPWAPVAYWRTGYPERE